MKIKNVAIKNFRGYSDEINSDFEDLTAFVGKNDIGKSTILEALDICSSEGLLKICELLLLLKPKLREPLKFFHKGENSDPNRDCLSEN